MRLILFYFFEILTVFEIVSFDLSLSNESSFCKLRLFLKDGLDGISHPPYKDDNLYCSIICFGDNPISHEIVTEIQLYQNLRKNSNYLHWSVFGNWNTVNSANWKLNSELIKSIYSLVVVDVESGIDIKDDNFSMDIWMFPLNEEILWEPCKYTEI